MKMSKWFNLWTICSFKVFLLFTYFIILNVEAQAKPEEFILKSNLDKVFQATASAKPMKYSKTFEIVEKKVLKV